MTRPLRIGLVLGGGGLVGLAYHAAALTALENDLGWDARQADIIVGTSAGSIVAGLLRQGVPPSDLSARAVGVEPAGSPLHLTNGLADPALPPWQVRSLLRRPRLPGPALLSSWARRPWRLDPVGAALGLLANGQVEATEHAAQLDAALGPDWPAATTWICAVRQHDLRRIVFGRTARPRPRPAQAVLASCAVPGYLAPVAIDGTRYVDGGVHSPTNAAVLAGEDLDLAIIVSPMTGRSPRAGIDGWIRRYARSKLDPERRAIERRGTPTVVLEPGPDVTGLLAGDFMDATRLRQIVSAAFLDTGAQLIAPRTRTLLAGLRRAPTPMVAS